MFIVCHIQIKEFINLTDLNKLIPIKFYLLMIHFAFSLFAIYIADTEKSKKKFIKSWSKKLLKIDKKNLRIFI